MAGRRNKKRRELFSRNRNLDSEIIFRFATNEDTEGNISVVSHTNPSGKMPPGYQGASAFWETHGAFSSPTHGILSSVYHRSWQNHKTGTGVVKKNNKLAAFSVDSAEDMNDDESAEKLPFLVINAKNQNFEILLDILDPAKNHKRDTPVCVPMWRSVDVLIRN